MSVIKIISVYLSVMLMTSASLIQAQITPKQAASHKQHWDTPQWADTLKNPYAHNAAMSDSGRVIYQKICSVCHGAGGKGDGVAAAGLAVQPANHTSDMVQLKSDGSLYYELTNGHAPMPSYKTVLTDKQRWQVVTYIRTLKPKKK